MKVLAIALILCLVHFCHCHTYSTPLDLIQYNNAGVRIEDDVSVQVAPQLLEKSGEWVTVKWNGVTNPSGAEWVGVYSPSENTTKIDPVKHAPIKFQYANYSDEHMKDGSGQLKFRLVNMRSDVVVGLFRGGLDKPVLIAVSGTVKFKNPNEPLQGHLALTNDPSEMILMWVTKDSKSPTVKWGTTSGKYSESKQATSNTYSEKDMCGKPATDFGYRDPGMMHQVTMDKLHPGTKYYYKFGDDEYGWSEEFMFMAAPSPGPNSTVKIVAFGDMGNGQPDDSRQFTVGQPPALNTTALVIKQLNDTDVVLHIGDISYARGYASVWDEFFDQIQPIATRVPYMVCIGNHERDFPQSKSYYEGYDSGGECGVPYERRFPMPRPSLDQPWYGFDYGPVHFLLMSTEHDFREGSTQYSYLHQKLMAVNRSRTPWLVFAGHRPMYIDSINSNGKTGDLPVATLLRENIEPLLKEYKVDITLWGHHHSYQRTCPVYKEICTDGAPRHFVIGMGGQGLSQNIMSTQPAWIEVVDVEHWGYSRFTVNSSMLVFEFVRDEDGKVRDRVELKKV